MEAPLGLFRRKTTQKTLVHMSNQEAAAYFVKVARRAHHLGNLDQANQMFQSAMLHDPTNVEGRLGYEMTLQALREIPEQATAC